jgi:hypothetical protein
MKETIRYFEEYLRLRLNKPITHELPKELYIRSFGNQFATTAPLTYSDLLKQQTGKTTFASFTYANDFRGQYPDNVMKGLSTGPEGNWKIIKPTLELSTSQGKHTSVENLAGASLSIGNLPGTTGVYRIQQNLSYLSEMLGIRSKIANEQGIPLNQVSDALVADYLKQQGWSPYGSHPIPENKWAKSAIKSDMQLFSPR